MRSTVCTPQVRLVHSLLPGRDRQLVELEEDALAPVLGRDCPGRPGGPGQRSKPLRQVADPIHVVDARVADEGVDLAQPLDRQHSGDLRPQVGIAVAGGQSQTTCLILVPGAERVFQQVSPLGDEQVDRIPRAELLFLLRHGDGRCRRGGDSSIQLVIGQRSDVDLTAFEKVSKHIEIVAVLGQLLTKGDPDLIREIVVLFLLRLRHHNDRLCRRKPQVRRADENQPGLVAATPGFECVQVWVAAPAPGQLDLPRLALRLVHRPALFARLAVDDRRRALPGCPIDHPQRRELRLRALFPVVDPEFVGKLVEMSVDAGEQIAGGNRGAAGRLAGLVSRPAGAFGVFEAGQVGAEGMGIAVVELRDQAEHVAPGAAQPLREHTRRHPEVVALTGKITLFRLPRMRAQLHVGGAQHHAHDFTQSWCTDLGNAVAPAPDPVPLSSPAGMIVNWGRSMIAPGP